MVKKKEQSNDEIVIRSLSDAQAVRTRPGMYVGGVENPSLIFREVIDGSFDESYATGCDSILISTGFNGYYFCCDNGRGIPCTMSLDDPGKTQALLAMSKLHAGSKFETTGIRAGMHGCGESATNFLSSRFILLSKITEQNYDKSIPAVKSLWESCGPRSKRDLFYIIAFEEGELVYEGALKKVDFERQFFGPEFPQGNYAELPSGYSTLVMFKPDPKIFTSCIAELPMQNIQNFLLIQEKFYGRKVSVNVDGTEMTTATFKPYQYEFVKTVIPVDTSLNDQVSVYITFEYDNTLGGRVETGSVNGLSVGQGIHITWIRSLFEEALKTEYGIKHQYLTNGLKIYVILLAGEVLYDSQTKTRLKSISKVKIDDLKPIIKEFQKIFKKNSDETQAYVDQLNRLADSMRNIGAIEKAQKLIDDASGRGLYKFKGEISAGFADAISQDRWKCSLFLTEGLSASASLKKGRKDTLYNAVMPLRGKVKNVKDSSADEMMENKEFLTIFQVIGLGIDAHNVTKDAKTSEEAYALIQAKTRYSKIVIATDADEDGYAIRNGLCYAFLKFARFIIDFGLLYVIESPIFEQNGVFYYPSDPVIQGTPFRVGMDPGKKYRRFKGLGSLDVNDVYDAFYDETKRRLFQVVPDGADFAMKLVEDIDARKQLLSNKGILTNPYNFTDL